MEYAGAVQPAPSEPTTLEQEAVVGDGHREFDVDCPPGGAARLRLDLGVDDVGFGIGRRTKTKTLRGATERHPHTCADGGTDHAGPGRQALPVVVRFVGEAPLDRPGHSLTAPDVSPETM